MPDALTSLRHPETPAPDDTALAQASRSHVANNGALQLIAEIIAKLRGSQFSWWTPELLRATWDATARMAWFEQRPDIRQRITCSLTGLRPKAARNKQPDFQAALIDSVIDDGDVTVNQFENEFDAIELATYAPVAAIWQRFRERMPWDQDLPPNQELVGWLIERLLASSSTVEGMKREPILTPYAIRTTIPGKVWHSRIPLDIRVAIDELRFEHERARPGEPFHAVHELSVATPAIIAANIPLRELLCVFDVAEKAMGLPASRGLPATAQSLKAAEPVKAEPPRGEVKAQPAISAFAKAPEKSPGIAGAEPPKVEVEVQPAAATVARVPETTAEVAKAEASKADAKTPPAPAVEKAPEKPADKAAGKPAEKLSDRWERMATKVLEKVGKESSSTEEPWNTKR